MAHVQNDAHEFFIALIERLETDLGQSFTQGIDKIFAGVTRTKIRCQESAFEKSSEEKFYAFPVIVEGLRSLEESLNLVIAKENIKDYEIEQGKKVDAEQTLAFVKLPPILSFHLCRFAYNAKSHAVEELRTPFECPFELDMRKYAPDVDGETKYDLYSVTAHSGNPVFGHYTSYIRTQNGEQWTLFNDGNTKVVDEQAVKRLFGTQNSSQISFFKAFQFNTALAYMLFYVRKDSFSYVVSNESIPLHLAPHKSNLLYSSFIFSEDLKGHPVSSSTVPFEWADPSMTAYDIISKLYPGRPLDGYNIWAQLPGKSQFIGPIKLSERPSEYIIKGHSTTFYLFPSKIVNFPVFVLSESTPRICIDCNEFNNIHPIPGHKLEHQRRPYEKSRTLHPGSSVISISKKTIILKFETLSNPGTRGVHRLGFPSDATYADVQKRLAMVFDIHPWRILVLHNNQPMIPHQYPYANLFPRTGLTYQVLKDPVTACSIKLFTPITMICISPSCIQKHNEPVWVRKSTTTSKELIAMLPKFFSPKTTERTKILCSIGKEEAIEYVLKPRDSPKKQCVRFDVIRYEVPFLRSRLKTMLKRGISMGIEVRFASSMASFSFEGTSRIISVTKTMTTKDIWQKMGSSTMDHPKQSFAFVSEKPKIRIELLPEDNIFKVFYKFVNKMTKDLQRLCIAFVSTNPMMVSKKNSTITRSLSGIINKKPKRDDRESKSLPQET